MPGRVLGDQEDPAEAAHRYAREVADAKGLFTIQIGDAEWLLVESFDIEWSLPDGDMIEVTLE